MILVGRMLQAYIRGLQSQGVMAVVKHFPGHGDTAEDSHITLPRINHSRDILDARELRPFIDAIGADVGAVMVAHIWFKAFDEYETPASLSHQIVTGLLREELGYTGIIMTDAMDMDAIALRYTPDRAAVMAVQAGVDLVVYGTSSVRHVRWGRCKLFYMRWRAVRLMKHALMNRYGGF